MRTERYDIIIIGSGAGGGTMAQALAETGARILILERGDFVPQEEENWSPEAVWRHLRYRTNERWLDERGGEFLPYTHYCVGGNTKFWGSVLYRLRREDFQAVEHVDGVSPAWPIDYETLEPYYERAERLYHVTASPASIRPSRRAGRIPYPADSALAGHGANRRAAAAQGLHPSPLPLGVLRPGRAGRLHPLQHLQFVSRARIHAKSEADVCGVRPAMRRPNVTLWTNALRASA